MAELGTLLRVRPPAPRASWRVALAVAAALLALAWSAHSWAPYDGDDNYYGSRALQIVGVPYDASLAHAAAFFHDTRPFTLDYGAVNPTLAPLIYPRVVLPLVAVPFVEVMGLDGMYVPGILFGVVTLLLLTLLAWRRVGRVGAAIVPVLLLGSTVALDFVFGIYTEAPVITLAAAMLWLLPLGGGRRRSWPHAVAAAGLVPLVLLSRQIPVLPVAMVGGGWLWTFATTRRWRNPWAPFVVTVTATTAACYAALQAWAPYDPLLYLRSVTRSGSTADLLRVLPVRFLDSMRIDAHLALLHDPVGLVLAALAVVGAVLSRRDPLVGVAVGAVGAVLLTVILNGNPTFWRYESPALPPVVLLAAVAAQRLWVRGWQRARAPGLLRAYDGQQAIEHARSWPLAVATWSLSALVVVLTVLVFQPSSRGGQRVEVSRATSRDWPFSVDRGWLSCSGDDYEVWFQSPDGERYALSGTAMARSFFSPRAVSIRAGSKTYGWAPAVTLVQQGMQLCEPGREYMTPPVAFFRHRGY